MLGDLWNRLVHGRRKAAAGLEDESEALTPEERGFAEQDVEGVQADGFVGGHLGGIDPDRLLGNNGPPPPQDEPPRA
jgi:hypothetical protein